MASSPGEDDAVPTEDGAARPGPGAAADGTAGGAGKSTKPDAAKVESAQQGSPGKRPGKKATILGNVLMNPNSGVGVEAEDSSSSTQVNYEVSARIADRYSKHVMAADMQRRSLFKPLDQQMVTCPDGIDMARSMKEELDSVLKRAAGPAGGIASAWDTVLLNDAFQKQLQFLNTHARTGYFIEQYGKDGTYEGEFLYGMRHGQGIHEFREEVYEGEWRWDQRHGNGVLKKVDGSHIKGDWQAGKPHGYVTIMDPEGKVMYEGFFKDGKRHGLGTQVFEKGDEYNGGWKHGKLHDRGVYYFQNGDKFIGMWADGLYDGVGVFHYTNGSMSRRHYKEGLLMAVQDMDPVQKYGRTLTREGMQKSTRDKQFPKDVFLLSTK